MNDLIARKILEWLAGRAGDAIENDQYRELIVELANLLFEMKDGTRPFKSAEEATHFMLGGEWPVTGADMLPPPPETFSC